MAASLLKGARLRSLTCVQVQGLAALSQDPVVSLSTKSGDEKNFPQNFKIHLDPIQKLFLDSIRLYSTKVAGGLVDSGPEYQKALAEELTKLQRLYGGGDLSAFPEFKFPEPKLDEVSK